MAKFFSFAVIGLGAGGIYALFALGLTMIFKVSRVPNFAHGAIALFIGYVHFTLAGDMTTSWRIPFRDPTNPIRLSGNLPFWGAFAISVAAAVLLGLFIERFAIRPFEGASMLTMVIVTLGITLILQAFTADVWGLQVNYGLGSGFPEGGVRLLADTRLTYSQLAFIGIAAGLALALAALFKYTNIGIAIRVTAENKDIARILGISPERVTAVGWAIGSALAGMAGIWVITIVGTDVLLIPFFLVIKGLAASLAGGMTGLVGTVIGGLGIGTVEALVNRFVKVTGLDQAVSFVAILILLLSRPPWIFKVVRREEESGLATRATVIKNLPLEAGARRLALALPVGHEQSVTRVFAGVTLILGSLALAGWGTGSISGLSLMVVAMSSFGAAAIAAANLPAPLRGRGLVMVAAGYVVLWPVMMRPTAGYGYWTFNGTTALIEFLVIVSLVLLTGWVGQISLGHIAFVGVGAFAAATMADRLGWPFWLVLPLGVLVSVPFSLIVGLPALRLRGFYLALTTLAFMYSVDKVVFKQSWLGSSPSRPQIGNFSFDSDIAYYYLCLVIVGTVLFGVWRLRDSRYGRNFRAIRESESTAASFGVNATRYKLLAFVLSGGMASLGGVLGAYATKNVEQLQFLPFYSILYLAFGVLGGITFISGAALAAVNYRVLPEVVRTEQGGITQQWIYIGGFAILLTMAVDPLGVVNQYRRARRAFQDARAVKRARTAGDLTETQAEVALEELAEKEASAAEAGLAGETTSEIQPEAEAERVLTGVQARSFRSGGTPPSEGPRSSQSIGGSPPEPPVRRRK